MVSTRSSFCLYLYVGYIILGLLRIDLVDCIVTVYSSNHTTPQSSNANMSCTVTSDKFIGWTDPFGRTVPLDSSMRRHVVSTGPRHDLIINNVNQNDRGTYRCQGGATSSPVMLYVEYRPRVIASQSTNSTQWTSYTDPDPVQVRCTFDGYPVPSVGLSKDSKPITTGITQDMGSLTYRFKTKTIDDYGFYACKATNSQGEAFHYVEVSKTGLPDPPGNITLKVGCDYVRVEWVPPFTVRGSPITSYRIELLKDSNTILGENLAPNERKKIFFELEKMTSYELRMNAKNDIGAGVWETLSLTTKAICAGQTHVPSIVLLMTTLLVAIATRL